LICILLFFFFFFFQAEDGIRDIGVTGVQTCALPIFRIRADEYDGETLVAMQIEAVRQAERRACEQ